MHGDTLMKTNYGLHTRWQFHHHLGIQKEKKPIFKRYYVSAKIVLFSLPLCCVFDFFHPKLYDLFFEDKWKSKRALPFVLFALINLF